MKLRNLQAVWVFLCVVFFASGTTLAATSYVDEHNRLIVNGDPFFPLGLYLYLRYSYPDTNELDAIADSSFDTLMHYNTAVTGDSDNAAFLAELPSRGLKLIFSLFVERCDDFNTECRIPGTVSDFESYIEDKVTTFKDDPSIIAWYLNDEICPLCLDYLEAGYNKVKELDNDHPIWSVHWKTNWLIEEAHTTDIVGVDPHSPGGVAWMADAANATGKPLWLVPHIYSATQAEMRAMTYLAVNHGAKGLVYYSYSDINSTRWQQIKEIAGEVDQLRPVFLSVDQTNETDVFCDNGKIDFNLMRQGNAHYLITVNTKQETVAGVSFQVNMIVESGGIDVLFESGRQVSLQDGSFEDDFGPYEVHVYSWEGTPDEDGDGVSDSDDNCPSTPNPGQEDSDGDGSGDPCDTCPNDPHDDVDGDGICGDVDNCPSTPNPGQEDSDGDGLGDGCDSCPNDAHNDADGDGICGDVDNCPSHSNPGQEDGDNDGVGDGCDNCPDLSNSDHIDSDGDGLGDACDGCVNDPHNDFDGDGLCGDVDLDDDDDDLPDAWELYYGLDPLDGTGSNGHDGDYDNDSWINYQEYVNGNDPANPDLTPPTPAHANPWYGVYRLSGAVPTGSCAHCHDTFNASTCGMNQRMLFAPGNPTSQTDNFCFECHSDPAASQQSDMIQNKDYGSTFGGGTANAVEIKDAFALGKPVGTWNDGSSHRLQYVRNWPKGKAWAPWVTSDTNGCVICHDPHHAQKNEQATPHSLGGIMTAVRRITHGGENTSNQWGDELLVTSGLAELMSDFTDKYQAPLRADSGYEPRADSTIQDGSNLPNFVTFCLDCHSREVPEAKTDAPNREHPQENLIAIDWQSNGDQMGAAHIPGHENGDVGGELKAPYAAGPDGNGDYVLSCTDCHEPHGSPNEFLLRTCVNGKDDCTVSANGHWYDFCSACHVIYTNDSSPRAAGMHTQFTTAQAASHNCIGCHGHKSPAWHRSF
jgi:predicted CXXCH cytochrome family protein